MTSVLLIMVAPTISIAAKKTWTTAQPSLAAMLKEGPGVADYHVLTTISWRKSAILTSANNKTEAAQYQCESAIRNHSLFVIRLFNF